MTAVWLSSPRRRGSSVVGRETLGSRLRGNDGTPHVTDSGERTGSWRAYALVAPALAVIFAFFALPLLLSAVLAFRTKDGEFTLEHFAKSWDLYRTDLLFTVG